VISPPKFENKLTKPNIAKTMLISMLLGVGAGAGAALLRDKMVNVFHTPHELAQALGLPLLGSVAFQNNLSEGADTARDALEELEKANPLKEPLRNLYTSIRLLRTDKKFRLLAITSTLQGEGRSTFTSLYARALSDLGKRVLVVDADLRHPMMHQYFGVANERGLSTLLSDGSSAPEQFIHAPRDSLHLLTAGPTPSDPPSLLSSERCAVLVEQIRSLGTYDYILFDLPPALELSDSLLISEHLDGILFLVSLGLVHRDLPAQALKRIQTTRTPVLGVVSNAVTSSERQAPAMVNDFQDQASALGRWRTKVLPWKGVAPESP
jgi:succinoglycan biosynthesis transport protein ExoP